MKCCNGLSGGYIDSILDSRFIHIAANSYDQTHKGELASDPGQNLSFSVVVVEGSWRNGGDKILSSQVRQGVPAVRTEGELSSGDRERRAQPLLRDIYHGGYGHGLWRCMIWRESWYHSIDAM